MVNQQIQLLRSATILAIHNHYDTITPKVIVSFFTTGAYHYPNFVNFDTYRVVTNYN